MLIKVSQNNFKKYRKGKLPRRNRIHFFMKYQKIFLLSAFIFIIAVPSNCLGKNASEEKDEMSSSTEDDQEVDMQEYLDDEVRFVTEDDFMYEEDRSHRENYQGTSRLSDQYERCPPLPQPSAVASSGLCEAQRCQRDDECSTDGSGICCYNGCIYSCLPKVNPPVAFDWVEETDLKNGGNEQQRALEDLRSTSGGGSIPKALLLSAEIPPQTITLPGGCYLSSKEYEDLLMFRRFDHIKACSCSRGEVYCEIKHDALPLKYGNFPTGTSWGYVIPMNWVWSELLKPLHNRWYRVHWLV